jgi:uncharacterized protein with ATP-grasp and redox domains
MKNFPACTPCLLRQARSALQQVDVDQATRERTLEKIIPILENADPALSPAALADQTNQIIREEVGQDDLYREMKDLSHQRAAEILEDLRGLVHRAENPMLQAVKVAAVGNVIDVVHDHQSLDLWEEVTTAVDHPLSGKDFPAFQARLKASDQLLYLADNVGETVFDRVLIETLDIPVIYAVKSAPILNDATREDALKAGIDQTAEVITTGSRGPGTLLEQCSEEFLDVFHSSGVVLAKGQANYETLDDQGPKVFFLLRIKCAVLGREIGFPLGDLVLKQGE